MTKSDPPSDRDQILAINWRDPAARARHFSYTKEEFEGYNREYGRECITSDPQEIQDLMEWIEQPDDKVLDEKDEEKDGEEKPR